MDDENKKNTVASLIDPQEIIDEASDLTQAVVLNFSKVKEMDSECKSYQGLTNQLYISCHTLKGASGLGGLKGIRLLSGHLEKFFDDLRMRKITLSQDSIILVNITIKAIQDLINFGDNTSVSEFEVLVKQFEALKVQVDLEAFTKELKQLVVSIGMNSSIINVINEYEERRLFDSIKKGLAVYMVVAHYDMVTFDTEMDHLKSIISQFGEVISTAPNIDEISDNEIVFNIVFVTNRSQDYVFDQISSLGELSKYDEYVVPVAEESCSQVDDSDLFADDGVASGFDFCDDDHSSDLEEEDVFLELGRIADSGEDNEN